MNDSVAKLRFIPQVRRDRDDFKALSERNATTYWSKCDVTTLVLTYHFTKFLSNVTIDTRNFTLQFDYRPHDVFSALPSRCTEVLQLRTALPHVSLPLDKNVWSSERRFYHTLCHQQIHSIANVDTETTRDIVVKSQHAPLVSSDNDFHYKPHHWHSSSHLGHAN